MQNVSKLTPTARLVFGALLLGIGSIPILGYFDIGLVGRDDINGPPWMAFAAGGVFVAAALAVMTGGRMPWLAEFMALAILVGFAAIGNWIAFGPGVRVCSGGMSVGGLGGEGGMSGLSCRIPFGLGAVIVNGLMVWVAVSMLQKALGGPPALARTKSAAETLLMACLAPIIIIALLFAVVPAVAKAVRTRVTTGRWPRNESFIRRQRERLMRRRGR